MTMRIRRSRLSRRVLSTPPRVSTPPFSMPASDASGTRGRLFDGSRLHCFHWVVSPFITSTLPTPIPFDCHHPKGNNQKFPLAVDATCGRAPPPDADVTCTRAPAFASGPIPALLVSATCARGAPRCGVAVVGKLLAKRGADRGQKRPAGNIDTLVGAATALAVGTTVAVASAVTVATAFVVCHGACDDGEALQEPRPRRTGSAQPSLPTPDHTPSAVGALHTTTATAEWPISTSPRAPASTLDAPRRPQAASADVPPRCGAAAPALAARPHRHSAAVASKPRASAKRTAAPRHAALPQRARQRRASPCRPAVSQRRQRRSRDPTATRQRLRRGRKRPSRRRRHRPPQPLTRG